MAEGEFRLTKGDLKKLLAALPGNESEFGD